MKPQTSALAVMLLCLSAGCGTVPTADFSLDQAARDILQAQQRAVDCGDTVNRVLSLELILNALVQQYETSASPLSFEQYVAEQVTVFNDHADQTCGDPDAPPAPSAPQP